MLHPRPVPQTGDRTTAAERALDPAGWRLTQAVREGLAEVVAQRRDVRRFRADDVDDVLVGRLLAAGHAAPSVGHSQPWRFIVVRDPATRQSAAVLADRERLRQAVDLEEEAGRQLLALRLEGLREAPVGIVVCCDRRAGAAGVLGRATMPDSDLWSCAAAIENIWLTARAEGLGLGWVTLFRPADLAELLHLPPGVESLGWLCVGWPDERPPGPGLERAGWSHRLALPDVVLAERWPAESGPAPPIDRRPGPSTQVGAGTAGATRAGARVRARDADDTLLAAPGALGLLGDVLADTDGLAAAGAGTLLIAAADHPVTAHGVSVFPTSVTGVVAAALAAGTGLGARTAAGVGVAMRLLDAGIGFGPGAGIGTGPGAGADPSPAGWVDARPRHPRGDLVGSDGLHGDDVDRLLALGRAEGARLAAAGPVALGEVGIGNTTVATVLAAALTGAPVELLAGRGADGDSDTVLRKCSVATAALRRTGPPTGTRGLLAALGGGEVCVLTGVVLGVAGAGGLVVLDGYLTCVAALLALREDPGVRHHLVAGQRSAEPGHALVLTELGCEPLLDLRLRAGEGVGAVLALSLLNLGRGARTTAARTAG